ncbi:MAG: hypothetical protein ACE5MB_08190 [Anaerolineae bacterium]
MSPEEKPGGEEIREEGVPYYYERYQEARDEHLASEIRRLEEAISYNAERIRDFREYVAQRFDAVDQRFEAVDQRFNSVDQRFSDYQVFLDQRLSDYKAFVDQRFAEQRSYTDQRFAEQRSYTDQRFAELRSYTDQRFAELRSYTDQRFAEQHSYMDRRFSDLEQRIAESNRWNRVMIGFVAMLVIAVLVKLFLG